jgi:hypothetical protein
MPMNTSFLNRKLLLIATIIARSSSPLQRLLFSIPVVDTFHKEARLMIKKIHFYLVIIFNIGGMTIPTNIWIVHC